MLDFYSVLTILLVLTAIFGYVNVRFIRLPATIGIMMISLFCSLLLLIVGKFYPSFIEKPVAFVHAANFETLLMRMMLSFLLFAGAIHVDVHQLRRQIASIATYAFVGVLISTAIVGFSMYFMFHLFDVNIPILYCLIFGALISPTDPIAVMGILKTAGIPPVHEVKITGESLFNDGVGVVVFVTLLDLLDESQGEFSIGRAGLLFLQEAGGGLAWGLVLGFVGYLLLKSIDHYQVEVLITIALVMGGYQLANIMHVSGPLAMVVAGIIIGNKASQEAMSDTTRDYVHKFWELIDEILNAFLFLLIGLEMVTLSYSPNVLLMGLAAIVVVLFARYFSVFLPTLFLSFRQKFDGKMVRLLTWGGLRGGISVALALYLPMNEYRQTFITITYTIVVFSIVVQGLTIGKYARKLKLSDTP